jgi:hypothetical protein
VKRRILSLVHCFGNDGDKEILYHGNDPQVERECNRGHLRTLLKGKNHNTYCCVRINLRCKMGLLMKIIKYELGILEGKK